MKIILSKGMNIVEALDDLKEVLIREYDGYALKVSSGTLYCNFLECPELKDKEFTLTAEGKLASPDSGATEANETLFSSIVLDRLRADLVMAERQLTRDKKKLSHASTMLSSSIEHNRRAETISSWKIEKARAEKEAGSLEKDIKHLKAIIACLEGRGGANSVQWFYGTVGSGYYKGKTGAVLLLSYPSGENMLYTYRGLKYLPKGTTVVDVSLFSDQLIIAVKKSK